MAGDQEVGGYMNTYRYRWVVVLAATAVTLCALSGTAQAARIRDLAQIGGVRDNQLLGFGLAGGLAGTGDDPKSAPYTAEAIANMLATFGFQIDPTQVQVKNFAAVMVTATLPAYVKDGDKLDVTVSAIGSCKSLSGGVLYQTLLKGADGGVYAVAQGPVSLGAIIGGGGGGGQQKQHMTVGRIPGGALIENSVPSTIVDGGGAISLNLNAPDFTTASAIVSAINKKLGAPMARAQDAGTVRVSVPDKYKNDLVPFIASLENIEAAPGESAKVVINQRTGTVVVGQNVEILPVAVTQGAMTLTFGEELNQAGKTPESAPAAGQAAPGAGGVPSIAAPGATPAAGAETPSAELLAPEEWKLKPTTAEHVAAGLNKMQLRAADIVAIFEALSAAGALMGELEII
jgi:flagellar P-ring protein FlgI